MSSPTPETVALFFQACAGGDIGPLRELLRNDPALVRASNPDGHYGAWTGLHSAAQNGHVDAVRVLLEHGADPNAREAGDNTCPLHWAAAAGHLESVRALLDAGGDVHGLGDVHELDAIGWATVFSRPGDNPREKAAPLIERGARHHIFSAIAIGDLDLIRTVVADVPHALDRRLSRFEQGQTPLHYAISQNRDDILELLIELGANLEALDSSGQTALAAAAVKGDRQAASRLQAAGAQPPAPVDPSIVRTGISELAGSTTKGVPAISVPDIAATLEWYASIGFTEVGRFADGDAVSWGMVSFGNAEIMFGMAGSATPNDVSLWFYTDKVDEIHQLLKSRQLSVAHAALSAEPGAEVVIEFVEELYDPPYGGRQFSIRDPNGYTLTFYSV